MSVVGDVELRRRNLRTSMPQSTEEFSGSTLQFFDRSPTATPAQTRSGSPTLGSPTPHTTAETTKFMSDLHAITGRDATPDTTNPTATMTSAGVIDGSVYVSTAMKMQYLAVYFFFNLGLTLYNKAVMIKFPFPFLLTALHAAAGALGTAVLLSCGYFNLTPITSKDSSVLFLFSLLYTANIAVSNLSLHLVTIPFHQVLRATAPIFVILIYRVFYRSTYPVDIYVSLLPIIVGVGLATYGDYYYTRLGFVMTLLGTILAALKTVVTNRIQTAGIHLSALELLYRMSPLAFLQSLVMAYVNGEIAEFHAFTHAPDKFSNAAVLIILVNGLMAFGLNIASFSANKRAGALTMTVAANIKQILTVLLAILFWDLEVGWINALGIALTLVGGAWYARVEMGGGKVEEGGAKMEEGEGEKDDEESTKTP